MIGLRLYILPSIAPFLTAFSALLGCGVLAVLCILHLTVRLLGGAQGGATTMHAWQQMSSDIRSVKTAMAKMNDSHVVLAHMIGQQSNLIRGGTGMTCEMYRVMMQWIWNKWICQPHSGSARKPATFSRYGSASSSAKGCQGLHEEGGDSQEEAACKAAAGCES